MKQSRFRKLSMQLIVMTVMLFIVGTAIGAVLLYTGSIDMYLQAKDDIPYMARIIAVADSYDTMTSNRSYRNFLPQDVVREEIEKNIGTQFDKASARAMLKIIDSDKLYMLHE
ncbi:MAG: hypothetical protein IKR76_09430 [Ruminococcus sp.]|nr:hypothetical protein [Ruminococcus sp.]